MCVQREGEGLDGGKGNGRNGEERGGEWERRTDEEEEVVVIMGIGNGKNGGGFYWEKGYR